MKWKKLENARYSVLQEMLWSYNTFRPSETFGICQWLWQRKKHWSMLIQHWSCNDLEKRSWSMSNWCWSIETLIFHDQCWFFTEDRWELELKMRYMILHTMSTTLKIRPEKFAFSADLPTFESGDGATVILHPSIRFPLFNNYVYIHITYSCLWF